MAKPAVNLFHLVAVVPLLVYLAVYAPRIPGWLRVPLVVLGALLIVFHGGMAVAERGQRKPPLAVRLTHVLLAGPLLLYLGLADSPHAAFPAVVAVVVFLFHASRLAQHWLVTRRRKQQQQQQQRRGAAKGGETELLILEEVAAAAL